MGVLVVSQSAVSGIANIFGQIATQFSKGDVNLTKVSFTLAVGSAIGGAFSVVITAAIAEVFAFGGFAFIASTATTSAILEALFVEIGYVVEYDSNVGKPKNEDENN